ncbi:hypothetical protein [Bradyrhizobium guangdongense]|uniref:Uncharacterized protein n=1 Tax=Bradyrhizobium guangdongense TaxID=1325090 RepID=A0A410VF48_9BRAD|nr:hypothetical protein [Bradyrhizobium guangdongense]QAU42310.1 hypothetical protein X265_35015 [Bradyrhizobium guangdongense]QOZ63368.1 hypothetical protein XH86_35055 [Bradyrhizobium guangdongense]GGI28786.1 hypothetical protein GCM10010987_51140 [Bradyrhizobium guangdongense]
MAKIENKTGNRTAKPGEPPKTVNHKAGKPQPPRDPDDDYEDGDIATPKLDRYGTDDEPL